MSLATMQKSGRRRVAKWVARLREYTIGMCHIVRGNRSPEGLKAQAHTTLIVGRGGLIWRSLNVLEDKALQTSSLLTMLRCQERFLL
jgi:hypothetical protein